MKPKSAIVCAAALALGLTACDKTPDVQGGWQGSVTPLELNDNGGVSAGQNVSSQVVTNLSFVRDAEGKTGMVEFQSNIDIINATPFNQQAVSPYEINIAATAVATGQYRFVDDDEMTVVIDPASVKVTVDPDAVTYGANVLTGQEMPAQVDSLKAQSVRNIQAMLTQKMRLYYGQFAKIDDIKVHGSVLQCEVADHDLTFQRK